jgi:hypothetical protein
MHKKQKAGRINKIDKIDEDDKIDKNIKIDQSCSITHTYSDGSCFTIEELHEIAENYNNNHTDQIKLYPGKKDMIQELEKKLKDQCSDQTCWATLKFLNDNTELSMAFKAKGPAGQYDWLSTTEINDCMERYMRLYKDFLFIGAVPIDIEDLDQFGVNKINYDKLDDVGYKKMGIVFNLDKHDQSGSHWVAFYANFDKNQIYYSDSASNTPDLRVKKLVKKIAEVMYKRDFGSKKIINLDAETYMNESGKNAMELVDGFDIRYNTMKHQYGGSECGVYSMNFLIRLLKGDTFDEIHSKRITDKDIHVCRQPYLSGYENIIGKSNYSTYC